MIVIGDVVVDDDGVVVDLKLPQNWEYTSRAVKRLCRARP